MKLPRYYADGDPDDPTPLDLSEEELADLEADIEDARFERRIARYDEGDAT